MKPTDMLIINPNQRRKVVIGKAFNVQHDLMDAVFYDSYNAGFNNFINLYERSKNWTDKETLLFEVKTDFIERVYLQWNHGVSVPDDFSAGLRFPSFITYIKEPTREGSQKIIDVDLKNMINFVEASTLTEYEGMVKSIEEANLHNKLIPIKNIDKLHTNIMHIAGLINDEFSRYSWIGGVFWGGKGFSYWGEWSAELMHNLATAGLVDENTNVGDRGYHAQRLCSVQMYKPTLVTNYYCNGDFGSFKYCCPAFFMLKGDSLYSVLERYYRLNFITTYKASIPVDVIFKWQESGNQDLRLWDGWREELKKTEDELRTMVFSTEKSG